MFRASHGLIGLAMFASTASTFGQQVKYDFKPGQSIAYQITVKAQWPKSVKTTTGFLQLWPEAAPGHEGQIGIRYQWGVRDVSVEAGGASRAYPGDPIDFLAPKAPPANPNTPMLYVNPHGGVTIAGDADQKIQLDYIIGPAWGLALEPLPADGSKSWKQHLDSVLVIETPSERPPDMIWGRAKPNRNPTPTQEDIEYSVDPPAGGVVVVHRKHSLQTDAKSGDKPIDSIAGEGTYTVDLATGHIKSLSFNETLEETSNNVSVKIPLTVEMHELTPDVVAKMQADGEVHRAAAKEAMAKFADKQKQDAEDRKSEHGEEVGSLPDGMGQTELVGVAGDPRFFYVAKDRSAVIGFRLQTAEWFNHRRFRMFQPLYVRPTEKAAQKPNRDETTVFAKTGFAVGAITVNADKESLNAICVTFMRLKEDGTLDAKDSYVSPWYGTPVGTSRKRLDGKGMPVFGVLGQKGLNVDSIGLITDAPPGNDTDSK